MLFEKLTMMGSLMKINRLLIILSIAVVLSACNKDEPGDKGRQTQGEGYVTLTFKMPENVWDESSGFPRSGNRVPGTESENFIDRVKFFIFDESGLEVYKEAITSGVSADPMWDVDNQSIRIPVKPGTKNIYCVLNWTDGAEGMPTLNKTTVTGITPLTATVRTHTSYSESPHIMTGEKAIEITGGEPSPVIIDVERQAARVELYMKIADELSLLNATVVIQSVKFHNLPSRSYLFRKSPVATPSATTLWDTPFTPTVTPLTLTTTYKPLDKTFYIPEYVPSDSSDAVIMEISGTLNGQTCYFNITIDPSQDKTFSHTSFVIERNHSYKYSIIIKGFGNINQLTKSAQDLNVDYELVIR